MKAKSLDKSMWPVQSGVPDEISESFRIWYAAAAAAYAISQYDISQFGVEGSEWPSMRPCLMVKDGEAHLGTLLVLPRLAYQFVPVIQLPDINSHVDNVESHVVIDRLNAINAAGWDVLGWDPAGSLVCLEFDSSHEEYNDHMVLLAGVTALSAAMARVSMMNQIISASLAEDPEPDCPRIGLIKMDDNQWGYAVSYDGESAVIGAMIPVMDKKIIEIVQLTHASLLSMMPVM